MTFHNGSLHASATCDERAQGHDVVVAGAGPVGLFLACELALGGCSVLVLEKETASHSVLKDVPFGIRGINAPSIAALDRRGLLDQLDVPRRLKDPHAGAVAGPQRQVGHFAGIPIHAGDVDATRWPYRLPSDTATHLIAELGELETVLARRAAALGVRIVRGMAVTGYEPSDRGVRIACGDRSFDAGWLVGCDGARSIVRKLGGFEFAGTEPEFTGYSVHVDLPDAGKLKPGRNMTASGMVLQSRPGYLAIQDFDGGAFHASGRPITREHVQEVLRRVSGTDVTVGALHVATTWTDRARQATTYRRGRVLLAGDAAHIHAPLGGQGLNLGLADAMNLGWKLAATIRGGAPDDLLDTYETERHPAGAKVLDWSRAQAAIMKPEAHARALNAILRDLLRTRDGATYVAERLWGVTTRYDLAGDHPVVGADAPNFAFEDGSRLHDFMRDGKAVLLDFDGHAPLRELAQVRGERMRYVTGRAQVPCGLAAALVRPDGFIAWACADDPDEARVAEVADRWFGRCPTTASA